MSETTIYCTTREAAEMLNVSLRTVQLWVESGLLEAWKTEGGHRRISRDSVQKLLVSQHTNAVLPAAPVASRFKILVVEDDNTLLKLYRTVIASWGLPIEVLTANNGIEGLILVGRESPDLMITDLSMPNMDGFVLINSLAHSSFREGMEIIVVTGLDAIDIERGGGIPSGIKMFSKPVSFVDLRNEVTGLLDKRSAYLRGEMS